MTVYRAQLGVHLDGQLPRDVMSITPHFDDHGISSDPQGLAEDLATGYASYLQGTKHVTCELYEAEGPPPHYPVGEATANVGQLANSNCPREVAVCLSFFSERNIPRRRGRVYVPMAALGLSVASVRPQGPTMIKVGELATLFMDLGGVDVDWVVWSRVDKVARPVTDWWVDDEWDTVRSRGLRPTTRVQGQTSEA
jgi:hypothetical protein